MMIEMQKSTHYLAIHIQIVDIFFTVTSISLTYNPFWVWKSFSVLFEDLGECLWERKVSGNGVNSLEERRQESPEASPFFSWFHSYFFFSLSWKIKPCLSTTHYRLKENSENLKKGISKIYAQPGRQKWRVVIWMVELSIFSSLYYCMWFQNIYNKYKQLCTHDIIYL